jgi:TolA-binding protein
MKIKNIKEEVPKDMENLRKKNQTETQDTVEGHSSRIEKVGDRISELEDKIEIKQKSEEMLVKQLKSYESNMQEITNQKTHEKMLTISGNKGNANQNHTKIPPHPC